jgi:hypothetical protein
MIHGADSLNTSKRGPVKSMKTPLLLIWIVLVSLFCESQQTTHSPVKKMYRAKLTNPLLPTGPDPWVIVKNGFYYYMKTTGADLTIWRTRS